MPPLFSSIIRFLAAPAIAATLALPGMVLPVAGTLYTGGIAGANAQTLDEATRERLAAMREGEMRKLNLHLRPRPAPEATFLDTEGGEHRLAETDGKVRLVNFWATWCAPCRTEKPSLDRLAAELTGDDFEVIAIAVGRHDLDAIERFNRDVGVEHLTTYLDPGSDVSAEAGVAGLPVTLLINREGEEIGRLMGGAEWDAPAARALIEEVIALGG